MTTVRVAWLQDALANRHIVTVCEGPIGEPCEIAPAEFLALGFALREELNVVRHGNGFLTEGNEGNERKKLEDFGLLAPGFSPAAGCGSANGKPLDNGRPFRPNVVSGAVPGL